MTAATTPDERWRLGYRPGLDGVRGIAVLLVLAFHVGWLPLGAGLTGVTVFFVLSGFLITRLLLAEHEASGRIDLRAFYIRRARRLLPALVVVLLAVGVFAWLMGRLDVLALPIVTTAAYVANVAKYVAGVPMHELGHTWTLAVEEQFYIVWPALLLMVGVPRYLDRPLRVLVPVFVLGVILRLAFGLHGFDAIAVGCLLGSVRRLPTFPAWMIVFGPLAIALAALTDGASYTAWGVWAAIAGSGCLIIEVEYRQVSQRLLSVRPIVALGLISYGVYLWQYPVIRGLRALIGEAAWVEIAASIVVAVVSYRVIERPFRRRRTMRVTTDYLRQCRQPIRHSGFPPP